MHFYRSTCYALIAAFAYIPVSHAALIVWSGPGSGGEWTEDSNWGGGVAPAASDSVNLSDATIIVGGANATYNSFVNGSGGTIDINSGGVLTQSGAATNGLRYFTQINVNSGGTLIVNSSVNIRSSLEVFSGGTLEGTSNIRGNVSLNMDGTFRPGGSSAASAYTINEGGDLILGSNGTIELDVFGDMDNESFSLNIGSNTVGSTLDLSTGTIDLKVHGYIPLLGDSFDLWDISNGNSSVTPGTGENIVLSGYILDLSEWTSDGVVTVSAVSSVPEPSVIGWLIGFSGVLQMLLRRRRV